MKSSAMLALCLACLLVYSADAHPRRRYFRTQYTSKDDGDDTAVNDDINQMRFSKTTYIQKIKNGIKNIPQTDDVTASEDKLEVKASSPNKAHKKTSTKKTKKNSDGAVRGLAQASKETKSSGSEDGDAKVSLKLEIKTLPTETPAKNHKNSTDKYKYKNEVLKQKKHTKGKGKNAWLKKNGKSKKQKKTGTTSGKLKKKLKRIFMPNSKKGKKKHHKKSRKHSKSVKKDNSRVPVPEGRKEQVQKGQNKTRTTPAKMKEAGFEMSAMKDLTTNQVDLNGMLDRLLKGGPESSLLSGSSGDQRSSSLSRLEELLEQLKVLNGRVIPVFMNHMGHMEKYNSVEISRNMVCMKLKRNTRSMNNDSQTSRNKAKKQESLEAQDDKVWKEAIQSIASGR